ncbi:MAG: TetR/AcrR family transcriptional regulator [Zoogloeaceae bacterium]|nr:TetR/AcrR family transcriptional regulator [Zoogloeaceae bacterium]
MARRGDHSRDKIHCMALDAAEAIVVAEGYSGLSARKVAAAIGYTVGMLYLVFENHNDLILQVNGRTLDRLHERLVAAVVSGNAENAAETTLTTLARAYIDYATSEAPRWNMLFEYIADKNDIVPEWYQYKLGRVFGLVETALRPLAQDEAETCRIARVLWAGVHGICTLKIRQRLDLAGGQSAEEMANMLIRNFLRGLQGG